MDWLRRQRATLLFPARQVSSTYFDTRDFRMFVDTVEGSTPRRKVRIRCYGVHDEQCQSTHSLETKQTTEQGRQKASEPCPQWRQLETSGLTDRVYGLCTPAVHITYRRTYYQVHGVRLTIDQNIRYRSLRGSGITNQTLTDFDTAVEVKAAAADSIDRLINAFPFPVTKFSKYERAVAGLFPRLTA